LFYFGISDFEPQSFRIGTPELQDWNPRALGLAHLGGVLLLIPEPWD